MEEFHPFASSFCHPLSNVSHAPRRYQAHGAVCEASPRAEALCVRAQVELQLGNDRNALTDSVAALRLDSSQLKVRHQIMLSISKSMYACENVFPASDMDWCMPTGR